MSAYTPKRKGAGAGLTKLAFAPLAQIALALTWLAIAVAWAERWLP